MSTVTVRIRSAVLAGAALLSLALPVWGATAAHAAKDPGNTMPCMDTIDQSGCPPWTPHPQIPADWIADQYTQSGSNLWGDTFYWRYDGKKSTQSDADRLARDLGYKRCDIPWWTAEVRCWD